MFLYSLDGHHNPFFKMAIHDKGIIILKYKRNCFQIAYPLCFQIAYPRCFQIAYPLCCI